jgi:hypothetical protein
MQSLKARIAHPIVLFELAFEQQTICIAAPLNSLTHNTNNSSAPLQKFGDDQDNRR